MQRLVEGLNLATIRLARPDDAAALAALIDELGYEATEAEVAERLTEVVELVGHVLVAEQDGIVVGCLSSSIMRAVHRPRPVGRISMMVVSEKLRGHGIGAMLVAEAERMLAEQGCGLVEVTSQMHRVRAHQFYEKLGYEKTSVRLARNLDGGPV